MGDRKYEPVIRLEKPWQGLNQGLDICHIGKPIGPFRTGGYGKSYRRQPDEVGHVTICYTAELISSEKRGHYSNDPAIRQAAKGTEFYP